MVPPVIIRKLRRTIDVDVDPENNCLFAVHGQ